MNPKKKIRNKIVVALKELGEVSGDADLSVRKIGSQLGISHGTVIQIINRDRKEYSIKKFLKGSGKKKKLSP